MARGLKAWRILLSIVLGVSIWQQWACGSSPQVPCLFIFGDSVFDNGNNLALETDVTVDYLPYGVDFPYGSTGRCSNGVNIADAIADLLGFENYIPPFGKGNCREFMNGVNYASGGSGILNMTGYLLGQRYTMDLQLYNHKIIASRIAKELGGADVANKYLGQCIYAVEMGYNDYLNNFYGEGYNSSNIYTPEQFAQLLVQTYEIQLERLYKEGARKIAVFGLIRIGCMPSYIQIFGADESSCVEKLNHAVQLFNNKLQKVIAKLNANHPVAKFTFINSYEIDSENYTDLGFKITDKGCCDVPTGEIPCAPLTYPCLNRDEHVYWDGAHYTEARARIFAKRAYKRQFPVDAYPYDISELAKVPNDEADGCSKFVWQ
uniref:GDSL esterase/lipase n=1 Tax=Populus alba TaxID=43335 RepID=A0A4U5Q731_POPAL|nr:GDSL esterase/lipase [Populus alba]